MRKMSWYNSLPEFNVLVIYSKHKKNRELVGHGWIFFVTRSY